MPAGASERRAPFMLSLGFGREQPTVVPRAGCRDTKSVGVLIAMYLMDTVDHEDHVVQHRLNLT